MWEILSVNSRFYSSNFHIHVKDLANIWVWMDNTSFILLWFLHVVQVQSVGPSQVILYVNKVIKLGITTRMRLAHVLSNCNMIFKASSSAAWTARHHFTQLSLYVCWNSLSPLTTLTNNWFLVLWTTKCSPLDSKVQMVQSSPSLGAGAFFQSCIISSRISKRKWVTSSKAISSMKDLMSHRVPMWVQRTGKLPHQENGEEKIIHYNCWWKFCVDC